jgi:hypothetical protein
VALEIVKWRCYDNQARRLATEYGHEASTNEPPTLWGVSKQPLHSANVLLAEMKCSFFRPPKRQPSAFLCGL